MSHFTNSNTLPTSVSPSSERHLRPIRQSKSSWRSCELVITHTVDLANSRRQKQERDRLGQHISSQMLNPSQHVVESIENLCLAYVGAKKVWIRRRGSTLEYRRKHDTQCNTVHNLDDRA